MDIEVVQPFKWRDVLAADSLWSKSEYPRAMRIQPLAGMCIAGISGLWMVLHESGGSGTFLVAFIFFWGIHLIVRFPLTRLRDFVRIVFGNRWRLSWQEPDVICFHDHGYIWNIVGEMRVTNRWSDLKEVVEWRNGIAIRCDDPGNLDQIQFLYVRKDAFCQADDYQRLLAFLRGKLAEAVPLSEGVT